jgi:D-alanine-D-alanine ligase
VAWHQVCSTYRRRYDIVFFMSERPMRITVLTHVEHEDDKNFDVVVGQVAGALREKGHTVSVLGVHADVKRLLNGLARRKPQLIFNLVESFGTSDSGHIGVAGLLELLGVPFTGGGAGEYYLQTDKALAKKLLAFSNIKYPDFAVFSKDAALETGGHLHLPLFVKPLTAEASIGIDGDSLVHTSTDMMKRVVEIHQKVNDSALVEEFIEGREFYVGVLGNHEPVAFPPIEMDFSGLADGIPHVLDSKAKWDESSPQYKGTKAVLADVPDELKAGLQKVALDAYRALRVRDYGRIDLRVTPAGEIYVIEVNASCYLERSSEFATAAAAAGLDYPTLIGRIGEHALQRRRQPDKMVRRKAKRKRQKEKPVPA